MRRSKKRRWLPLVGLFVILTCAAIYAGYLLSNLLFDYFYWRDDTAAPVTQKPQDDADNPNADLPALPNIETVLTIPTFSYYHVQVGSFAERQNADRLVAELSQENVYAAVQQFYYEDKLFHRVIVAAYSDREFAEEQAEVFRIKGYPVSVHEHTHPQLQLELNSGAEDLSADDIYTVEAFHNVIKLMTAYERGDLLLAEYSSRIKNESDKFMVSADFMNYTGSDQAVVVLMELHSKLMQFFTECQVSTQVPPGYSQDARVLFLECLELYNQLVAALVK